MNEYVAQGHFDRVRTVTSANVWTPRGTDRYIPLSGMLEVQKQSTELTCSLVKFHAWPHSKLYFYCVCDYSFFLDWYSVLKELISRATHWIFNRTFLISLNLKSYEDKRCLRRNWSGDSLRSAFLMIPTNRSVNVVVVWISLVQLWAVLILN